MKYLLKIIQMLLSIKSINYINYKDDTRKNFIYTTCETTKSEGKR